MSAYDPLAFNQSVQVRRIAYGTRSQPMAAATGRDTSDSTEDTVLDPVMKYNPYWDIIDYPWDNTLGYRVYYHVET